jgi:uncharacterized protein YhaN
MNSLFQEFTRDVLNVKSTKTSTPIMPSPFTAFLKEETRKTRNIEELEHQRKQLKQHIRMMQEKVKSIDEELAERKSKK